MKNFTLKMIPALPRAEEELLSLIKEPHDAPPIKKSLLQAILDNLPFNLLVYDDQAHIAFANVNLCELVGFSKEELIGLKLEEFAELVVNPPYDYSRYPRILNGETITKYNYIFRDKMGKIFPVEFNSYPLRISQDTKPIGCLIVITPSGE